MVDRREPRASALIAALAAILPILVGSVSLARATQTTASGAATAKPPAPFEGLEYRSVGPAIGGRVSRVGGIPGDPSTYWAATSAGGVWKSVNGGLDWRPVFDDQPAHSIGSIAVAPSDPNIVYVGSGEANIRGNVAAGNGIYKSTDGGANWEHVWHQVGQIGTMVVDPRDPDIAYAAVLGNPFASNPERGVYRTRDGGRRWLQVLRTDADTGASDIALDPANPRILFAGFWQARRLPWEMTSGGPGSGLWTSRDGGDSWTELSGAGLPDKPWGKVGVGVAPSDPRRVYALIEAEQGGLFRSDDGGKGWELVNASRGLRQRAWYYTTLTVDPTDADVVWFPQVPMLKTEDGGRTVRAVKAGGWDYHDAWIDPANPRRMIVGSDAGVSLSSDGGETWLRPPLPIGQFYHVTTDRSVPYRILGAAQDWGTASGPSDSLHSGGIYLSDWQGVGGGEAGHVQADPSDPAIVWAGEYLGIITRYDGRARQARNVSIYPENGSGRGAGELAYRFQWTAPIVISPHDPQTVYHAANVLFRTRDGGLSWEPISPDLTRNDPEKLGWTGGPITGDNTGVEYYCTIFAVAESPLAAGTIWAGTDDGLVHLTRDGGATWTNVTPPEIPGWATVTTVEASRWDAGTAYVVAEAHRLGDFRPYLWRTSDHGQTWTSLTGALAPDTYLHVVREDREASGLLYLGTERGVRVSRDAGASWEDLQLNLPTVAVHDLVAEERDLVVGTMGRSIWVLDDVTPVREWSQQVERRAVHLLPPPPAIRWRTDYAYGDERAAGANPQRGALVTYWLEEKPEGAFTLEILDASGALVRRLSSEPEPFVTPPDHPDWDADSSREPKGALPVEPGLRRAAWDLRHAGAELIPGARWEGDPATGPLVVPGEYTLRLTVGERVETATVRVDPDPRSPATAADLGAQAAFLLELRDALSRLGSLVARARSLGEQLTTRADLLAEDAFGDEAEAGAGGREIRELTADQLSLAERLAAFERELHNADAEVDYDVLARGAKLYSRLATLYSYANYGDGPPTQGMREVAAGQRREIEERAAELDELLHEVEAINRRSAELEVGAVIGH